MIWCFWTDNRASASDQSRTDRSCLVPLPVTSAHSVWTLPGNQKDHHRQQSIQPHPVAGVPALASEGTKGGGRERATNDSLSACSHGKRTAQHGYSLAPWKHVNGPCISRFRRITRTKEGHRLLQPGLGGRPLSYHFGFPLGHLMRNLSEDESVERLKLEELSPLSCGMKRETGSFGRG